MRTTLVMTAALLLTAFLAPSEARDAVQPNQTATFDQATTPVQTAKPVKPAPPAASVNLNTATARQLEALPGVGPATAARIVEYREKNGRFKKIEDLMNVRGIGEKTFLNLKPMIVVTPVKGLTW